MLGRDRHRLAEAESEGLVGARRAAAAFGLVGDDNGRLAGAAQHVGKHAIVRHDAGTGIDEEQHRVGVRDRSLGLGPHAAREAFGPGFLQARRVDDREGQVAEPRRAFAPVARDAGGIVDQRDTPASEAVE